MPVTITHATTTAKPSDPTKDVSATAWNENHTVTGLGSAAEANVGDFATAGHDHTGVYEPANANIQSHISSTSNPHSVTAAQIGAQPVDADLTAIAALGFTSTAFLKKTAADTWALDTNTYSTTSHNHDASYQPLASVLTNTTASFTTAQETKLAGIASGATANSSDATLLSRANHTGTQGAGTITGLATVATSGSAADLTGNLAVGRLNGGAGASSSTFWRGDGTWASAGGGSPTGVLSDLQLSVLQSDGTLNAASGVQTWAGTNKTAQDVFTVAANSTYRVKGQWYVNTGATSHTTTVAGGWA